MSNSKANDEALLIDFTLGACSDEQAAEIRQRLARDEAFAAVDADVRRTFAAMDLAGDREPPEDLVEKTLAKVRSARETDALLAREQLARRDVLRPTFSLGELGAVAAAVLLVVGVFAISYREAARRKDQMACAARQARLGAAMLTYANKNDGHLPAAASEARRWLPAEADEKPAVSNSAGLFRLVKDGYVEPSTFQCPAVGGKPFVVQAGMSDFPASENISYSYQHAVGTRGLWIEDPRLAGVKDSFAILADSSPLFDGRRFRRERVQRPISDNHDHRGQNVLYLDGHTDFHPASTVGVGGDNIYLADGVYEYDGDEAPSGPTDSFLLPAYTDAPAGAGRAVLPQQD